MIQARRRGGPWVVAAALLMAFGCSSPQPATGSVQLVAMLQGATADEVTRLRVTVTAQDMEPLTSDLQKTGGTWGGTLSNIPAGTGRTFTAEAFDTAGVKRFAGEAPNVTLTAGQTAVVSITLQQMDVPPEFQNEAPTIVWLTASTDRVQPGGTVLLESQAQDGNAGDTLTYAWTGTAGSFDGPSSASTRWTAPMTPGPVALTLTVTDSKGASATLGLTLTVEGSVTDGGVNGASASVGAVFNAWPQVTRITASPSFLAAGETASVEALASDVDGDALSYQWTVLDGCPGTLASASSRTASFTAGEPLPDGSPTLFCSVRVTVTDGRGGQGSGTLRFFLGDKPSAVFPPRVTSSSQSAATVNAGESVTFSVTAVDPQSSALSFQWQGGGGTLGTPVSGFATSEVTWTAPSCLPAAIPTVGVAVRVRNARFATASKAFTVTVAGPACAGPAWMDTSAMALTRTQHTATVLSSGKVLVAGGIYNRTAELYDPALRLWQPAVSMSVERAAHAAVLLPSGKVLVTGGRQHYDNPQASTESYDPGTHTWTPRASMLQARFGHTATVLSSGKVLVAGGTNETDTWLNSAELYDPGTNTWTATGNMSIGRTGHVAVPLPSGKVLVVGRGPVAYSSTVELYDPDTGTWSSSNLTRTVRNPTAALLSSGKVLIVGDQGMPGAELYDPATGTSTATGSPFEVHTGVTPVVLPSGKVLLAGGGYDAPIGGNATEVYDPSTGTWSSTGTLSTPRSYHTVSMLPVGLVLVVGGQGSTSYSGLDSAELYLP